MRRRRRRDLLWNDYIRRRTILALGSCQSKFRRNFYNDFSPEKC